MNSHPQRNADPPSDLRRRIYSSRVAGRKVSTHRFPGILNKPSSEANRSYHSREDLRTCDGNDSLLYLRSLEQQVSSPTCWLCRRGLKSVQHTSMSFCVSQEFFSLPLEGFGFCVASMIIECESKYTCKSSNSLVRLFRV